MDCKKKIIEVCSESMYFKCLIQEYNKQITHEKETRSKENINPKHFCLILKSKFLHYLRVFQYDVQFSMNSFLSDKKKKIILFCQDCEMCYTSSYNMCTTLHLGLGTLKNQLLREEVLFQGGCWKNKRETFSTGQVFCSLVFGFLLLLLL